MNDAIPHKLKERVKELTALHRTARILQDHGRPIAEVMQEIADLLPGAWQYPEVAAARIQFRDAQVQTEGFRESPWFQRAEFHTRAGHGGEITLVYLEERAPADEGPFLAEERDLIDSLAKMLRSHMRHMLADEALREARDRFEAQVLERTADLRRLASRLTLAEERERRRIASDLHDHVGQALAIIKMRVREFQGNAVFGGFEESIEEIMRLLDLTIRYARDLTGVISPPVLYELGLEPALDWLAEQFREKRKLRVRLRTRGRSRELPDELAVMLFKSASELLLNCLKHSGATKASLELRWEKNTLTLRVSDRGQGFDPEQLRSRIGDRFGLFSIRERFRDLGGRVEIDASPGGGCRVTLGVSLPNEEAS